MAEAIVGPLLSKLQDVVVTEAKALAGVGGEIEKLSDKLMWLQALVHETNLRSRHDGSRLVQVLACQIRAVAFEAEDAVDQFYLKGGLSRRFGLNWGRAAVELIVNLRSHFSVRFVLAGRIQLMNARLEEIVKNTSVYGMRHGSSGDVMTWRASRAIPPTRDDWENSVQFKLIGRKNEECELRNQLLAEYGPTVIHIVGVGGIGKRSLLRWCTSEEASIKEHFVVCAHMSFPPGCSSSSILQQIKAKLVRELRCLVVIDSPIRTTTWSEVEPELLQEVRAGSKILLTEASRHKQANGGVINLGTLTKEDINQLFNHVVGLDARRKSDYASAMLNKIVDNTEQITNGLPLAVVLLGKFMTTMAYNKWEAAYTYIMGNHEDDLLKTILYVCIDDLPDELKSCLLYTACFPDNKGIDAHHLVRLWMAEGFLTQQQGLETEQLGQRYLKELIYRGLLELTHKTSSADGGRVELVAIHDHIHPLLRIEAQRTGFMDFHYGGCVPPPANTRRLTMFKYNNKFSAPSSCMDKLRTIVSYSSDAYTDSIGGANPRNEQSRKNPTFLRKLLRESPFLRVIDLEGHNDDTQLPDEIGEMVQLQYLAVRCESLEKVPSSIRNLGRLQTVDVRGTRVKELPKSLWKIKTLRHVLGDGLNFPRATRELKLMQTLETVTIRDFDIWCTAIGRRRKKFGLRLLHSLRIVGLDEAQQQDLETILKDLGYLERLSLSAGDEHHIPIDLFAGASSASGACLDHVASLELDGKLLHRDPSSGTILFPRYLTAAEEAASAAAEEAVSAATQEAVSACSSDIEVNLPPNACLSNLTSLVLRRTSIAQDFVYAIAKLPVLAELVMQEASYVGDEVVFCTHGHRFNSLAVLRITSLYTLRRITVHSVATRMTKDVEPIFVDMNMEKITSNDQLCSCCDTTIIRGHIHELRYPPMPRSEEDQEIGDMVTS